MSVKEGFYKHYKGKVYFVIGVARHSETLEPMVVYKAKYASEFGGDALWVRPESMFEESVEIDGRIVRRFEPISAIEAHEIITRNKV